ncbi:MAG: sugar transferase [Clostridia bacterium]|nr:sugar transferase [Clostridia bacterium]MDD4386504.1 sugar transferase [Clostridia bacterium]
MYSKYFKRIIDFTLSLIALIVLSPIILITAILIRIKLGSPVIFKQKRPGLNEKIFTLYKFRTMTDEKNNKNELLSDEIRLTKFGKLLRTLSLDELPQLVNILKGDMSIIGPRPLLIEYLDRYNDIQRKRHDVRPGLTGLAQVNGRNAITWEEKFKNDVEYTKKITFLNDFKILLITVKIVFKKVGICEKNNVTMSVFEGKISDDIGDVAHE